MKINYNDRKLLINKYVKEGLNNKEITKRINNLMEFYKIKPKKKDFNEEFERLWTEL